MITHSLSPKPINQYCWGFGFHLSSLWLLFTPHSNKKSIFWMYVFLKYNNIINVFLWLPGTAHDLRHPKVLPVPASVSAESGHHSGRRQAEPVPRAQCLSWACIWWETAAVWRRFPLLVPGLSGPAPPSHQHHRYPVVVLLQLSTPQVGRPHSSPAGSAPLGVDVISLSCTSQSLRLVRRDGFRTIGSPKYAHSSCLFI